MSLAIDEFSSVNPGYTGIAQTFVSLAKTALIVGIFLGVMKTLEPYLGYTPDTSPSFSASSDSDDENFEVHAYEPIVEVQTNVQNSDIASFATENVSQATTALKKEEEKEEEILNQEEVPQFVIGAEDVVDHINRIIG